MNHSADSKLNRSIENRIDLRCNHGLLTGDVGVRVEMWLQLDVSHSDVRGYTSGVHTRRFSLVCLLESACNLDLSYNRFQWCKCTGLDCLCTLRYAEKDCSRNRVIGSTINNIRENTSISLSLRENDK